MKLKDLINEIEKYGATFKREGGSHTVYKDAKGKNLVIPRHREIAEGTASSIIRKAKKAYEN
ncbi:MAG: type II toxin-antitoxin system HicA family toxin [Pseudobacteriovorax sp.]|nr:type II toxin-antitoxin system HicA family toxin [Pseudobacteriovorax sp.]